MIQDVQYIDIVYKIFKERLEYLQKNPPIKVKQKLEQYDFQKIMNYLLQFKNKDLEIQKFAANLFLQASKCFETYGKNQLGEDRFPFSKNINFSTSDVALNFSMLTLVYFQKYEITFKPFTLNNILDKALECIKKNICVVSQILNQDITQEQLEWFLNDQEVLIFQHGKEGIDCIISGLSSIDGRKVYVSNALVQKFYTHYQLFKDDHEEEVSLNDSIDSNHGDLYWNYFKRIQWTIEHHMMENITKYFSQQIDHRSISPERNPNLRIQGTMVGSGRFFEKKAHNRKFNQPNPLILNMQRTSQIGFY